LLDDVNARINEIYKIMKTKDWDKTRELYPSLEDEADSTIISALSSYRHDFKTISGLSLMGKVHIEVELMQKLTDAMHTTFANAIRHTYAKNNFIPNRTPTDIDLNLTSIGRIKL
jgi:hypothetical protein